MILLQNCIMEDHDSHRQFALGVTVRQATHADAKMIASLLYEAFAQYRPLYTERGFAATVITADEVVNRLKEGPMWVAIRADEIVGTASAVRKSDGLYVRGMAVEPEVRAQGIGASLLEQVENYATRKGSHRMFLSTTPFLEHAIRLYEKFGFARIADGPHDLFGTPLFTMEKRLSRRT